MKSIKPGRGPSMMSAVGATFAVVFGIIWTMAAASMGAPFFFPLFGLVFIGIGVFNVIYNLKNATGQNRYSAYDIVEENEEPDPLNLRFGSEDTAADNAAPASNTFAFCPYCGMELEEDFAFCPRCGKQLPDNQ